MAALSVSDLSPSLKQIWEGEYRLLYEKAPLLAMIPKSTKMKGEYHNISVNYGPGGGVGGTFATQQTNVASSKRVKYALTPAHVYGVFQVGGEVMDQAANGGALIDAWNAELKPKFISVKQRLAAALYRDGSGALGQENGTWSSGNTFTLADKSSAQAFHVGQVIRSSATALGALRTGSCTITAVNRTTGALTVDNIAGITGFAASDYIFVSGDAYNNSAYILPRGLDYWTASSVWGVTTTTDSFLAIRTSDQSALGTITQALIDGASLSADHQGMPTHAFMHPIKFAKLVSELQSGMRFAPASYTKTVGTYSTKSKKAQIGFRGCEIMLPTGPVECYPDVFCPKDYVYVLELDSLKLLSIGKLVKFAQYGQEQIVVYNADAAEGRLVSRCQLASEAPGHNVRVKVP